MNNYYPLLLILQYTIFYFKAQYIKYINFYYYSKQSTKKHIKTVYIKNLININQEECSICLNIMKNDIFKGKMHGAIGIGSAKNYQEELLNYLASKDTTYGGFNAEELKRGIIGFLLSDLMCVATDIEIRIPSGIEVFSSDIVTKDSDNYSWIKIPKLMLDEIKAFSTSAPCEIEISYRNRVTGDRIVLKRTVENVQDDLSVDTFCRFSQKFKNMIENPTKLKDLYNEMEKVTFNINCILFSDWIELVKEVKTFSEMKKDKDYQMASKQYTAGVTRTFSSQVRSVTINTPNP
jgi:hypothetical protein